MVSEDIGPGNRPPSFRQHFAYGIGDHNDFAAALPYHKRYSSAAMSLAKGDPLVRSKPRLTTNLQGRCIDLLAFDQDSSTVYRVTEEVARCLMILFRNLEQIGNLEIVELASYLAEIRFKLVGHSMS